MMFLIVCAHILLVKLMSLCLTPGMSGFEKQQLFKIHLHAFVRGFLNLI